MKERKANPGIQLSLFDPNILEGVKVHSPDLPQTNERQPFIARPYQQRTVDAVIEELKTVRSTLAVLPTGTGKTYTFAALTKKHLDNGGNRVLVVVHRDELVDQVVTALGVVCPEVSYELENQGNRALRSCEAQYVSQVVVCMVGTIAGERRLSSFPWYEFDLIIIDEAHHCVPDSISYWSILSYFREAKVAGFTATPDRADGKSLGNAFDTVAISIEIEDMILGDDGGWLVPIVQQYCTIEDYDLDSLLEFYKTKPRDFKEKELDQQLTKEKPLQGVAQAACEYSNHGGQKRQTLIFASSTDHAMLLCEILNRRHRKDGTGRAAYVVSGDVETDERKEIVQKYREGFYRYLVNHGCFTEGFDVADTRVVVIARPTMARSLYAQMVGRGLRPSADIAHKLNLCKDADERRALIAASTKPACMIVDMIGVSGQHKLVMDCAKLLAGNDEGEVVQLARFGIQRSHKQRVYIFDELKEAREKYKVEREKRRRDLVLNCKLIKKTVDPFNRLEVKGKRRRANYMKGKRPTEKMIETLLKAGLTREEAAKYDYPGAKELLEKIFHRWENNLCSIKQGRTLRRFGYDPTEVTFENASRLIDAIAKNRWKRIPDDDPLINEVFFNKEQEA